MSVEVTGVDKGSPAQRAGIQPGDVLETLNGHEIVDVLDFRFYQNEKRLIAVYLRNGKRRRAKIRKGEYEETGMEFSTYLMDKQHSCRNKCIFCFIDQMPPGMRESLYFKDDDSRLSFLFGNYITLTNISEHEVQRIIEMHISPINISVHTTNPELRVKMMKNRFAGEALSILHRLAAAGIELNCQLVLCPGINDGEELRRSLSDLTAYESVACVACVPVGLTKYREGLEPLRPFTAKEAAEVIDLIDEFGDKMEKERGGRVAYASDEFYLLSGREIPPAAYYGDFLQLENGVGLWALLKSEAQKALEDQEPPKAARHISVATGVSAAALLKEIAKSCEKRWENFRCDVYTIENRFFGPLITVAGLVTGGDLLEQLKGKDLHDGLYIPSVMLRQHEDCFLDDITLRDVKKQLNVPVIPVNNDGYELIAAFAGENI